MNIMGLLNKIILALSFTVFSSQIIAQNGQIQFKTKIVKGTCEFDDNSELDKYIDFNQNGVLIASDIDSKPINQPIKTENFSYTIICKNYPENTDKKIKIKAKSAASTQFSNNVFFGLTDTTKTGFLLESCDKNNQNCQMVSNEGISSFPSASSDTIVVNYRVSLVKRENNVTAGDSNAAVTFEYYQD